MCARQPCVRYQRMAVQYMYRITLSATMAIKMLQPALHFHPPPQQSRARIHATDATSTKLPHTTGTTGLRRGVLRCFGAPGVAAGQLRGGERAVQGAGRSCPQEPPQLRRCWWALPRGWPWWRQGRSSCSVAANRVACCGPSPPRRWRLPSTLLRRPLKRCLVAVVASCWGGSVAGARRQIE